MLMLQLYIGDDRFALECAHVIEIIPQVNLKQIPYAPDYVAGMLNYRGIPVPVIDICKLIVDRPCISRLHTRIILLRFIIDPKQPPYIFGLLAEKVTETMQHEKSQFVDSGIRVKDVPYLGGVFTDKHGSTQFILLENLFDHVRKVVFSEN